MSSARPSDGEPMLVVIPNVGAAERDGRLFLDIKAVEGLMLYARFWPGTTRCLFRACDVADIGYGRWYARDELPFEVCRLPADAPATAAAELVDARAGAAVILAGADDHRDFGLVGIARPNPVVFIIEYAWRTRVDILRLAAVGPLRKARRFVWLLLRERERRRALRSAAAIQANGRPAFDDYAALSRDPLLYFDTRLAEHLFVDPDRVAAKTAAAAGRPLRLGFSGRLEPMKGADHLLPVARALAARNLAFTLDIFGDGSLAPAMTREIADRGLSHAVRMRGPVDFATALVPAMQTGIDLFLCCHRQSDPSCTYLETLGCGVPIVGYANRAFLGVLALGDCGVAVGMDDVAGMADAVVALDRDRQRLADLVRGAVAVAGPRLFEPLARERIAHLSRVARRRGA